MFAVFRVESLPGRSILSFVFDSMNSCRTCVLLSVCKLGACVLVIACTLMHLRVCLYSCSLVSKYLCVRFAGLCLNVCMYSCAFLSKCLYVLLYAFFYVFLVLLFVYV